MEKKYTKKRKIVYKKANNQKLIVNLQNVIKIHQIIIYKIYNKWNNQINQMIINKTQQKNPIIKMFNILKIKDQII